MPLTAPLPRSEHYYLVVRPLGAHPREFADRVEELATATGADPFTLRQKLAGTALEVFSGGDDAAPLQTTAAALQRRGVAACVVAKTGIDRGNSPRRCARIVFSPETLHFLAPDGRRVATLHRGDPCLLVVGALDVRRLQNKLLARQAARRAPSLGLEDTLALAFRNDPLLDLYLPGQAAPVRLHGRRFDFTCLGERNRGAVGSNFPQVLDDIRQRAGALVLDTGFGQKLYPFLTWPQPYDAEPMLAQFDRYSRFVQRAREAGLFAAPAQGNAGTPLTGLSNLLDPIGLLWTAAASAPAGGALPGSSAHPRPRQPAPPEPPPLPPQYC